MRIEDAEQAVRQLGEFVIELVLDAGREEGESLDQPLHMRIIAASLDEEEPAGRVGILLAELLGELTEVGQLAFVDAV